MGPTPPSDVYVPDELLTQIREADISVSPVCQEALELEVRKVNAMRTTINPDRLARARERLAASTGNEAVLERSQRFEAGRQVGRDWALDVATAEELDIASDPVTGDHGSCFIPAPAISDAVQPAV